MEKCFEIDDGGEVYNGIRVDMFTDRDGITRPSIVVGGKGMGSLYGVIPIFTDKNDPLVRFTDNSNRVYGLWLDKNNERNHISFDYTTTFSTVAKDPERFGSSSALIAFRTENRCSSIASYTSNLETITCMDGMCRWQYVGRPKSMTRRCQECESYVKSQFKPFPGSILVDGEARDDHNRDIVGIEVVARIRMGNAFRIATRVDEGNPIEHFFQFNGSKVESLGSYQEDRHGYQIKIQ